MADTPFFLKKKARPRPASAKPANKPPLPRPAPAANRPPPPKVGQAALKAKAEANDKATVKTNGDVDNNNIVEIKIFSADPNSDLRYNTMRLNSNRDVDLTQLPRPLLMNRKQPGPKAPPQFATDDNGKIIGHYVYDDNGKPVLDAEGKPTIAKKTEMDMSLVGQAPGVGGGKRRGKRSVKEVFHQDVEVIKLRREEANPWVLESKNQSENPNIPEHWVGRMVEPSTLPSVLLVNDGQDLSFTMVPLGRQYRFEPERPFKVMDSDQANKYYEMQAKYKIHDRWGQRQTGTSSGTGSRSNTEPTGSATSRMHHLEERAQRLESNIMANSAAPRPVKRERFEDDYEREGRSIGRGLEGGADEELDFDVEEEFQDDDDQNTFYHNREEDEERKFQEERQKKEFRWANANVGDRPQIEGDDDDDDKKDDLFGDELTKEGKRLRKVIRKSGMFGDDEDMYDSSDEDESDEDEEKKDQPKAPGAVDKPSRAGSRSGSVGPGDGDRATGSPSRRRPAPDRAGTAPPGAGAALLAKRAASRGASPRPGGGSRAGSPLARGSSPDTGRGGSPAPNGVARSGSPAPGGVRAGPSQGGTPQPAKAPKSKSAKRKATSESPLRDSAPAPLTSSAPAKRKAPMPDEPSRTPSGSPAPADAVERANKKKKKGRSATGSATPGPDVEEFPGMIARQEVLDWLLSQEDDLIPMKNAIQAFTPRIQGEHKDDQQRLFLTWIKLFTDRPESRALSLKPEYRRQA